jgi:hypothetical protein
MTITPRIRLSIHDTWDDKVVVAIRAQLGFGQSFSAGTDSYCHGATNGVHSRKRVIALAKKD